MRVLTEGAFRPHDADRGLSPGGFFDMTGIVAMHRHAGTVAAHRTDDVHQVNGGNHLIVTVL